MPVVDVARASTRDGGAGDEAAVRNVLERLGPPEEIAAEAGAGTPGPERGRLETAAMLVLVMSFALPFAGYLRRWRHFRAGC